MAGRKKVFSFFIILVCIAVIAFFVWSKINPNVSIINEILSGSVTGIIAIGVGVILLIAIIKFLRGSTGRESVKYSGDE
jgi:hypothetical protein